MGQYPTLQTRDVQPMLAHVPTLVERRVFQGGMQHHH